MYHEQVKRYLDLFPREQVHIMLFDDFKQDVAGAMSDLLVFWGGSCPGIDYSKRYNEAGMPRFGKLNYWMTQIRAVRIICKKLFPDNLKQRLKSVIYPEGHPEDHLRRAKTAGRPVPGRCGTPFCTHIGMISATGSARTLRAEMIDGTENSLFLHPQIPITDSFGAGDIIHNNSIIATWQLNCVYSATGAKSSLLSHSSSSVHRTPRRTIH